MQCRISAQFFGAARRDRGPLLDRVCRNGPLQTLDIYSPRGVKGAPVIVFFYGGSWQEGSKETYPFVATSLARKGIFDHRPRLSGLPGGAVFPPFSKMALRPSVGRRRMHGNSAAIPPRIVLMGHSAGAYIASMLAVDAQWLGSLGLDPRRDIAGLIGISGPYDFLPIRDPVLQTIFGGADRAVTQPITFVRGGEVPALLLTGSTDTTVDPGNTTRLADRLRAAGSGVREIVYPGVKHLTIIGAFAPVLSFVAPVLSDVDDFITHLRTSRASGGTE